MGERSLSEEGTSKPEQRARKSCGGATLRTPPQRHARGEGQRLMGGRAGGEASRADWLGCLGKGKWKNGGCFPGHSWAERDAVYLDVKTEGRQRFGGNQDTVLHVPSVRGLLDSRCPAASWMVKAGVPAEGGAGEDGEGGLTASEEGVWLSAVGRCQGAEQRGLVAGNIQKCCLDWVKNHTRGF